MRNVANMYLLLRQQLARFDDACLIHELRMCQVLFCQPTLQGARADAQLLCHPYQRRMSGRQQLRYYVADFIDWNTGFAHGCYTLRDNPSFIVVTIIAAH